MEIARDNADKLRTVCSTLFRLMKLFFSKKVISLFLADPTVNWNNFRVTKGRSQKESNKKELSKDERLDELNNVMKRINYIAQVDGTSAADVLPANHYLQHLIDKATSPENLSRMWHGWAPNY